jgi:hypothetical protein
VRRALLLSTVLGAPAASIALVVACSDSGTLVTSPDAGGDASSLDGTTGSDGAETDGASETGPGDGGFTDGPLPDGCGPGPYVTLGMIVDALNLGGGDASPLPGVELSSPLCPTYVGYSDEGGVVSVRISAGIPFYGALTDPKYVSELSPELSLDADTSDIKLDMLPSILEGLFGWDGGSAVVAIAVDLVSKDAGACSSVDGVTLAVQGDPSARVVYLSDQTIPMPVPDAGSTTTRGFAAIFDVPSSGFVTLTGTKPGCQVIFTRDHLTGRVPVANGFVSLMPAYLSP